MQLDLITEPIFSVQVHIYCSHLYTFHNTFYIEAIKRYARGIAVTVIQHSHPLHQISELPFAIVNATHIVTKPRLQGLLQTMSTQRPLRLLFLKPILTLCEQLAAVGRIVSQQPSNPYYLMLSPMKKLQVYTWNNKFKKHIFQTTQYFHPYTQQLNKQHFLYKLDILTTYVSKVDKTPLVTLCIYAFIKSLKIDNKMLYQTAIKNQILVKFQQNGLLLINQPIRPQMSQIRFIVNVPQQKQQQNKQKQQQKNNQISKNIKLEFLSRLVLPVIIFGTFWKVHKNLTKG